VKAGKVEILSILPTESHTRRQSPVPEGVECQAGTGNLQVEQRKDNFHVSLS